MICSVHSGVVDKGDGISNKSAHSSTHMMVNLHNLNYTGNEKPQESLPRRDDQFAGKSLFYSENNSLGSLDTNSSRSELEM